MPAIVARLACFDAEVSPLSDPTLLESRGYLRNYELQDIPKPLECILAAGIRLIVTNGGKYMAGASIL